MSENDAQFLKRLRSRDTSAFDELVRIEGPRLSRLVQRLLGWSDEPDDIVQDVFVDAWQNIHQFRNDSSLSTWLSGIAINRTRNFVRRRRTWKNCFSKLCEFWATDNTSEETMSGVEHIYQAINQLNHRHREVIVLTGLENQTIEQAARLLGIQKNTVEVRLHRARRELKQKLASGP